MERGVARVRGQGHPPSRGPPPSRELTEPRGPREWARFLLAPPPPREAAEREPVGTTPVPGSPCRHSKGLYPPPSTLLPAGATRVRGLSPSPQPAPTAAPQPRLEIPSINEDGASFATGWATAPVPRGPGVNSSGKITRGKWGGGTLLQPPSTAGEASDGTERVAGAAPARKSRWVFDGICVQVRYPWPWSGGGRGGGPAPGFLTPGCPSGVGARVHAGRGSPAPAADSSSRCGRCPSPKHNTHPPPPPKKSNRGKQRMSWKYTNQ